MVALRTVAHRMAAPKMVVPKTAAHDSTLAPRMVDHRTVALRMVAHRLLNLPLPRRLRLPRSLWRLSLQLRRLSRAQRPVPLMRAV